MPTRHAALLAVALLSSACAMAESIKVTLPLKGPADSRQDAVKAEVAKIVGVAEATLAEGALVVTLKEGKQVGLVQIAAALKTASAAEAVEVDESKLSLGGGFDVVLFTAAEEGSFGEGAVEGILSASGKVTVENIDAANEPVREGGETTIVRVSYLPNEGEAQKVDELRTLFAETLLTPPTAENGFGIVDIRWGVPAAEEGK